MKPNFVIYRKASGEIVSTGGGIDFHDPVAEIQISSALGPWGEEYAVAEGVGDRETNYVAMLDERAVIAERSPLTVHTVDDKVTLAANGEDSIVLTGLPNPCEIIIDDPDPDVETDVISVSGGGFVFVADDPGVYTVEVRRWPFLPLKIEFTAT